jgi:glycosyltransferase involved in cell wall biosynthesis
VSELRASLDVSAIPERPAGAGRYVIELVRQLAERDELDLMLLARRGDRSRWEAIGPAARTIDLVPSARALRLAYEQLRLGSEIRRLDVDIHHGPHYTMPGRCPVPAVVTIHDLTFFDRPELHERSKVLLFRRAIRQAAKRAAVLVCVSEVTASRLAELLEPRAPVIVAPHGIDHQRFAPTEPTPGADAIALAALGLEPTASRIVSVGTLEPRKGVVTLLEAFERIAGLRPELELVFAGQRGWGLDEFDRRLAASPARERIRVLGYVDEATLPALLRHASVVAYASVDEGFGLPALEALACGAPLVTSQGSVMASLCGPAPWLVDPLDPASLASGLEAALDASAAERSRRRAEGLERASGFSWQATAELHLEAYRVAAEAGGIRREK